MTSISLKDASGREFRLGPPERDQVDPLVVSVRVPQILPPGPYTVAWQTAASDGHPSHGSFGFVVLAEEAPPANGALPGIGSASDTIGSGKGTAGSLTRAESGEEAGEASSIGSSLARAFSFVGILILVGATAFRALVLPRVRGMSAEVTPLMKGRAAVLGIAASLLVILSAFARLFLESEMMSEMPGMQSVSMTEMAMHTHWGFALRVEIGAAVLALLFFAQAVRRVRSAWLVASISAIVLAITPALAGHAASSPRFTALLIGADFLHVLGGASWLGGLLVVMLVGIPVALTLDGAQRWSTVASLVNSFSPVALISATVVVVSGVLASWVHLDRLSALWQTAYGQVLLVKLFLVALTLTIGAYNFRRVQPQLVSEGGAGHLRRSAAIELSVGFLVLLVTGFLTGISP
jgi:putative copper export protein